VGGVLAGTTNSTKKKEAGREARLLGWGHSIPAAGRNLRCPAPPLHKRGNGLLGRFHDLRHR